MIELRQCTECRFFGNPIKYWPCNVCKWISAGDEDRWVSKVDAITNLQLQLDAANKRIAELQDAWLQDETIEVDGKLRPSVTALRNDVLTLRGIVDKQKEQLAAKDAEIDAANKRAENQWFLKVERSGDYVRAIEERDIALMNESELKADLADANKRVAELAEQEASNGYRIVELVEERDIALATCTELAEDYDAFRYRIDIERRWGRLK